MTYLLRNCILYDLYVGTKKYFSGALKQRKYMFFYFNIYKLIKNTLLF